MGHSIDVQASDLEILDYALTRGLVAAHADEAVAVDAQQHDLARSRIAGIVRLRQLTGAAMLDRDRRLGVVVDGPEPVARVRRGPLPPVQLRPVARLADARRRREYREPCSCAARIYGGDCAHTIDLAYEGGAR